jgi:hypothetical protein
MKLLFVFLIMLPIAGTCMEHSSEVSSELEKSSQSIHELPNDIIDNNNIDRILEVNPPPKDADLGDVIGEMSKPKRTFMTILVTILSYARTS